MAKFTSGSKPDPMEREVDQLLAQLAHSHRTESGGDTDARPGEETVPAIQWNGGGALQSPGSGGTTMTFGVNSGSGVSDTPPSTHNRVALWSRVVLGATLGILMTDWPYANACGLGLLGYSGAIATVLITGGWIAFLSWKQRSGAAHIMALLLFYWGIVLAAEQLLPRIGYASPRAGWQCPASPPQPR